MKMRTGWSLFSLVLTALSATAASADSLTVTRKLTEEEQRAATAYWTPERISAAPALEMPVDHGSGAIDPSVLRDVSTGPLGRALAGEAAWDADLVAQSAYWQDWLDLEAEAPVASPDAQAGSPGVYTFYDVNLYPGLWQIYPHKWVGKLTFNTPSGSSSCSATVISGNNIVTAAHCVYDTASRNRFYSGWVFTPAFRNGSAPYGRFTANACTVLTSWVNLSGSFSISTWTRHDVAVCTLNRNSANQTVNAAIGWAGRTWNAANAQQVFSSGYPARTYTDALIPSGPTQFLRACTAETFLYASQTLGGGCYWGRGISGGSWLLDYKPFVVSGFVDSVTSGLFIGQQNLYGARFNGNNIVPLCNARGC